MATYTITIKMDNAAFEGGETTEVRRILHELADELETNIIPAVRQLHDINGNLVGKAKRTG